MESPRSKHSSHLSKEAHVLRFGEVHVVEHVGVHHVHTLTGNLRQERNGISENDLGRSKDGRSPPTTRQRHPYVGSIHPADDKPASLEVP